MISTSSLQLIWLRRLIPSLTWPFCRVMRMRDLPRENEVSIPQPKLGRTRTSYPVCQQILRPYRVPQYHSTRSMTKPIVSSCRRLQKSYSGLQQGPAICQRHQRPVHQRRRSKRMRRRQRRSRPKARRPKPGCSTASCTTPHTGGTAASRDTRGRRLDTQSTKSRPNACTATRR